MAEADLDVVIRQAARLQHKSLLAAAKARRDHLMKLASGAKTAEARERHRLMARAAIEHGTAAARRLQMAADNAADSYARALRNAAATPLPVKPAAKKAGDKATAKKSAKGPAKKQPAKTAKKKAAK